MQNGTEGEDRHQAIPGASEIPVKVPFKLPRVTSLYSNCSYEFRPILDVLDTMTHLMQNLRESNLNITTESG